jgi:alanine racemase
VIRVQASINRKALAHNLAIARTHARGGKLVAVIKANAYGHGLLPVAEALHEADIFGVTDLEEAERLRAGGTDKEILLLQGPMARTEVARIAQQGFQSVIHNSHQLAWLEQELSGHTPGKPLTFWLKLESGMNRLGLSAAEFKAAYLGLQAKSWTGNIVVMTHLASASTPESALNTRQLQNFRACKSGLENTVPESSGDSAGLLDSISASGALLALATPADVKAGQEEVQLVFSQSLSTWARPGIML